MSKNIIIKDRNGNPKIYEGIDKVIFMDTEGNDATFVLQEQIPASVIFGENSPEIISAVSQEISANNMTSQEVFDTYGWSLGDKTSITLTTGEVIEMQIIGFNHDDKSDGSGKAGITLQMVDCLATRYTMNSTNTNAGGYAASKMKTETLPTLKALLPQEWQDVIKLVDKKSANGGGSNYSETLTTSDNLFLLSGVEVFGSEGSYGTAQDGANEGNQYEYWNGKGAVDRIKKRDEDADGVPERDEIWFMRSCIYFLGSDFSSVGTDGAARNSSATSICGVVFAFCI